MAERSIEIPLPKLLLEHEVALRLKCTRASLRRARLQGKLSYYRTRPITISEDDLAKYIAQTKANKGTQRNVKAIVVHARAQPREQPIELITDAEAAARYGHTTKAIKRLRYLGRLPYVPGYPPLLDAADVAEYFEKKRLAALAKIPPTPGTPEFAAALELKTRNRMRARLHKKRVGRRVAKILQEMAARAQAIKD